MLRPPLSVVTQLMRRSIDRLQREGVVRSREGRIVMLNEVFSFSPSDVDSVHYTQKSGGDGVLFRLRSGRVFDERGQASELPPGETVNTPPVA